MLFAYCLYIILCCSGFLSLSSHSIETASSQLCWNNLFFRGTVDSIAAQWLLNWSVEKKHCQVLSVLSLHLHWQKNADIQDSLTEWNVLNSLVPILFLKWNSLNKNWFPTQVCRFCITVIGISKWMFMPIYTTLLLCPSSTWMGNVQSLTFKKKQLKRNLFCLSGNHLAIEFLHTWTYMMRNVLQDEESVS